VLSSTTPAADSMCKGCAAGQFSQSAGDTSCSQCATGRFRSGAEGGGQGGGAVCGWCPEGYYQGAVGGISCTACEAGKAQSKVGSLSCSKCTPGTHQPLTASSVCVPLSTPTMEGAGGCARGRFRAPMATNAADSTGFGCFSCPAGTVLTSVSQPNLALTRCSLLPAFYSICLHSSSFTRQVSVWPCADVVHGLCGREVSMGYIGVLLS
jgi:hypothetical protein